MYTEDWLKDGEIEEQCPDDYYLNYDYDSIFNGIVANNQLQGRYNS